MSQTAKRRAKSKNFISLFANSFWSLHLKEQRSVSENQFSTALRKEVEATVAPRAARATAVAKTTPVTVKPGRLGKRNLTGYFPPAVVKQFKQIALDRDTTVQNLLGEALDDIFAKYRMPQIARKK